MFCIVTNQRIRVRHASAVLGAVLCFVVGSACRDRSMDETYASIAKSDSSGVEVWSLAGKPALSDLPLSRSAWLADLASLEVDEVRQIRLAQLQQDGRIALAMTRPLRVALIDTLGAIQRLVGRTGDGPGEYRAVSAIRLKDDGGLVYFDVVSRRLTEHRSDNSVKHATTYASLKDRPDAALTSPVGVFRDGSVLARAGRPPAMASGLTRPTFEFVRLRIDGNVDIHPGTFEGDEVFMGTPNSNGFAPMGVPPFGRKAVTSICGDGFVVAQNASLEVHWRDPDGQTKRVFRAASSPYSLSTEDYVAYWRKSGLAEPQQEDVDRIRQMTHGDSLPIINALHCGSDEQLVIEFESRPTDETKILWYLRSSWDKIAGFRIPAKARVLAIAGNRLLVAWQDGETRVALGAFTLSH